MRVGLLISTMLWVGICYVCTGCAAVVPNPFGDGFYATLGDERGILANADHDAAMISEGKATADTKGSYYQLREMQASFRVAKPKGGAR